MGKYWRGIYRRLIRVGEKMAEKITGKSRPGEEDFSVIFIGGEREATARASISPGSKHLMHPVSVAASAGWPITVCVSQLCNGFGFSGGKGLPMSHKAV